MKLDLMRFVELVSIKMILSIKEVLFHVNGLGE